MRHLILSIGRSCFTQCRGCYNHFGSVGSPLLESDAIIRFLQRVQSTPLRKVTVGGGDPLSRVDLLDILEATRALGFATHLDTVGTPFLSASHTIFYGRQLVQKVSLTHVASLVERVAIPLDGSTDAIAGQFRRGRPNLVSETRRILDQADHYTVPISINTVVGRHNIDDLTRIWEVLREHPSITTWQLFQFMPIGPLGNRNRNCFGVDEDAFLAACSVLKHQIVLSDSRMILESKSCRSRKNLYLLGNDDGTAWTPKSSDHVRWRAHEDVTEERNILGNIRCEPDLDFIVSQIFNESNVPGSATDTVPEESIEA